jgi:hypothetical protein
MGERDSATVERAWIKSQSGSRILSWNSYSFCNHATLQRNSAAN